MLKSKLRAVTIFACLLACLVSCVADEDYWASNDIIGRWRVAEIEMYSGRCPFYEGDYLRFYSDGGLTVENYDVYQEGAWDIYHGQLGIDLDYDGYYEINAYIRQHDTGYFVLDAVDEGYGRYVLRLVR